MILVQIFAQRVIVRQRSPFVFSGKSTTSNQREIPIKPSYLTTKRAKSPIFNKIQ